MVLTGMGPVFLFALTRVRWYVWAISFGRTKKAARFFNGAAQTTTRVVALESSHQIGNSARSAKFRAWARRRLEYQATSEE